MIGASAGKVWRPPLASPVLDAGPPAAADASRPRPSLPDSPGARMTIPATDRTSHG